MPSNAEHIPRIGIIIKNKILFYSGIRLFPFDLKRK